MSRYPFEPTAKFDHLSTNDQYLPFIDGLRAIAVLAVIIFHLEAAWLPGGFLGVDLFFIISGYVVSRAASQITPSAPQSFLLAFYAKRMARIIPPLLVCLLITFIFSTLFIPTAWLTQTIDKTGLWAFMGLSNLVLSESNQNYFSPVTELNPFTHTWSLGIEEQFYALFAFIFLFWKKIQGRIIFLITTIITLSSLAYACYMLYSYKIDYFSSLIRGWELAIGVLLFQWQATKKANFKRHLVITPSAMQWIIAGSIASILSAFFLVKSENSILIGALWVAFPTLFLLHFCQCLPSLFQRLFLENKVSIFIGKISYSLYLWHWPIFVGYKWTIGLEGSMQKFTALVGVGLFSLTSYFLIEKTTRRWLKKIHAAYCVLFCIVLSLFSYEISLQIIEHKGFLSLSNAVRNPGLWYPNAIFNDNLTDPCVAKEKTKMLNESIVWIYEREGECSLDRAYSQTLYVLGDSHALQYRAMLFEFTSKTGIPVHLYSNGGCPFMSLLPHSAGRSISCREFNNNSYADIEKKIKKGDYLFLSSARMLRRVDHWGGVSNLASIYEDIHSEQTLKIIKNEALEFEKLLSDLSHKGVSVIFSAPTPTWGFVPFRCDDWFNNKNPICSDNQPMSKEVFSDLRAPIMQALSELTHKLPKSKIWDTLPILCPQAYCEAKYQGRPLYFDGDHLSGYANTLLEPSFEELILGPAQSK
jgi:peptidoglycan/LPS O-acetylase OafA/YrhL